MPCLRIKEIANYLVVDHWQILCIQMEILIYGMTNSNIEDFLLLFLVERNSDRIIIIQAISSSTYASD